MEQISIQLPEIGYVALGDFQPNQILEKFHDALVTISMMNDFKRNILQEFLLVRIAPEQAATIKKDVV
jgi:hypothetical protein